MPLLTIILQLIAIYLIARAAIVLAFTGCQPEEVQPIKAALAGRLTPAAAILLVLAFFYGFGLLATEDFKYHHLQRLPKEQADAVEQRYAECMDEAFPKPRHLPKDREEEAWRTIVAGTERKCLAQAYKEQGLRYPVHDRSVRLAALIAFFKANKTATAAFVGLAVVVPCLMWKSRDVERLKTKENRIAIITRAIWHLYVGASMQLALLVFASLS